MVALDQKNLQLVIYLSFEGNITKKYYHFIIPQFCISAKLYSYFYNVTITKCSLRESIRMTGPSALKQFAN